MARSYNGTSQYHSRSGAIVTATPCTLACWFNPNALTTSYTMLGCGNSGTTSGQISLQFQGSAAGDPVRAIHQSDNAVNGIAAVNTSISAGTWHHAAAVFNTVASRQAFIDGTGGTVETTSLGANAVTADFTTIGASRMSTITNLTAGSIAECGIWNVSLTATEVAGLASGLSPLLVRRASLVAYWPMFYVTDEVDWIGAYSLTATAAPGVVSHPRIFYPKRSQFFSRTPPSAGGVFANIVGQKFSLAGSGGLAG